VLVLGLKHITIAGFAMHDGSSGWAIASIEAKLVESDHVNRQNNGRTDSQSTRAGTHHRLHSIKAVV
jgi:hypothetical protein